MTHTGRSARLTRLPRCACIVAASLIFITGCASTGPNSPSAKPVLYPNATLNRVGAVQARVEADACMSRAGAEGLTPDERSDVIGRRAGEGAAVAGVASAVSALITGRGASETLRAAAGGAAVGGSVGAVSGAFHNDRPNTTYRQFVQRCLSEKGFEVIGWN